ncbi:hypothetical protein [Streptomyces cupreus]|uniref:hypothetical protein n=1 Tax=Streptomyces cupreus TaxID=2759956 RepID=UPI0021B287F7|nr:hypothetical protein [Streptomyces cupreus]
MLESLRRKLDGGEAGVETMRRKRKVPVHALHYAVERGELGSHPLERIRWRVPKPAVAVDPRVLANLYHARDLLSAVSYVGGYRRARGRRLVGIFAGQASGGPTPASTTTSAVLPVTIAPGSRLKGVAVFELRLPPLWATNC